MKKNFFLLILLLVIMSSTGSLIEINKAVTSENFWNVHGFWFLIFMNIFPRITMYIATPFPIGIGGFFGWLIAPRIYAAILATTFYWSTNPTLCVITWIIALGTTGVTITIGEKKLQFKKN